MPTGADSAWRPSCPGRSGPRRQFPGEMLASLTPSLSHQLKNPLKRQLLRFLRMRIQVLGVEELIPGEPGRTPCPLDQLGHVRRAVGNLDAS